MGMYQRPLRQDELMHYGVLGMKWGVRRYQPYAIGRGGEKPGIEIGEAKKITKKMDKAFRTQNTQVARVFNRQADIDYRKEKLDKRQAKYDKKQSNWNKRRLTKANTKYENAKLKFKSEFQKGKDATDEYNRLGQKLVENNYDVYVKEFTDTNYLTGKRAAEHALKAIGSGLLKDGKVVKVTSYDPYTGVSYGDDYYLQQKGRKHKIRASNTNPDHDRIKRGG